MVEHGPGTGSPTLVFDGECGFCSTTARMVERRLAPPELVVVAWQQADLERLGLTAEECAERVRWVGPAGEHEGGAAAVAALLRANPRPWRWIGRLLQLPGVRAVAARVYDLVSANRSRLPGGTPACRVDRSR